jgi:hypothetical protein
MPAEWLSAVATTTLEAARQRLRLARRGRIRPGGQRKPAARLARTKEVSFQHGPLSEPDNFETQFRDAPWRRVIDLARRA